MKRIEMIGRTFGRLTVVGEETTARAKSRRIVAKAIGAHRPKGQPMPGTKRSGWRKRMDGTVERR